LRSKNIVYRLICEGEHGTNAAWKAGIEEAKRKNGKKRRKKQIDRYK